MDIPVTFSMNSLLHILSNNQNRLRLFILAGSSLLFTVCINISLFFSQRSAEGCQFNSLNISFVVISYGLPVMILAALFCIFCNLSSRYSLQLLQTNTNSV